MTGRDLIVYILQNHLEDEDIFKDGVFVGFMKASEVASRLNVGTATIRAWVDMKYMNGIIINDEVYIPVKWKEPKL